MTTKRKHKRQSPYSYRPPEALREKFDRLVAESGLSVNAFITQSWNGRNRHRPAELKSLARILAVCGETADLLRTILRSRRFDDHGVLLAEIKVHLTEIRSALFLLMGRKP